jgi:glycosyltransferase 2 family protein
MTDPRTGRALRVFSSAAKDERFRRATDILMLVPAFVVLAILVAAYPPGRFERALAVLLNTVPGWLEPPGAFVYDLLVATAIALGVTALLARRLLIVLQALASLALALVVALVAARLALGHWPDVAAAAWGGPSSPRFPGVRLAETAAVVLAISPHLVHPLQRASRWMLALGFAGALVVDAAASSGYVAGLLIAVVAAAGVRLALGTSAGLPGLAEVAASLGELRVPVERLELADRDRAGVVVVRGRSTDGRALLVKVYGRDAYDNQLVEKFWRTLWYRDAGPGLRLSRLQATEHEAFATLLASSAGVPALEVLRAGTTTGDDALLVLSGDARPLADVPPGELDDGHVAGAWRALALLHGANVAHRRLDTSTIAVIGGEVGFVDYGGSTTTPTLAHLMTDRAQLVVATTTCVGAGRALAAAVATIGNDGVASLLPYLQVAALEDRLRQETRVAGIDVDAIRHDAAALVGAEEPQVVQLRRVTWRSLLQTGLLLLAALAILSFGTGIDYEQFATGLSNASWAWIAVGFVAAQAPRLTQSVATLGSVAADLRFGPVYAMQLASGYMNLALPSVAARLAVSVRFFQRQGITAAAAVTSGAIDSLAGTVVQAVLLSLLLIFSESTLSFSVSAPSTQVIVLVTVVATLLILAVVLIAFIGRARRVVTTRVRQWWPEIRAALGTLRSSDKLALLLFGTLATEVLFAFALGMFAIGLGTRVSLTDLLVINIGVSLLSTFIPVPGGIGVTELGLTVGLVGAGMSEESALAAVLLYRISVFYLPPVWGFFALRWLQRKRYL